MRVLKIGGSVITDKSKRRTPRPDAMARLALEMAGRAGELVLVHGAGSCGHDSAARYGISEGLSAGAETGLFVTHKEVARLCEMLCASLQDAGIPALPLHPLDLAVTADKRISSFNTLPVKACLERGVLPVLHGDVTFDTEQGAAILSGDQLVVHLALELRASDVGLGTEVDGVLGPDGGVIRNITPDMLPQLRSLLEGSAHVDVTGGMLGKVEELCRLARQGVSSTVFNASVDGNVRSFLENQPLGTHIHGDERHG